MSFPSFHQLLEAREMEKLKEKLSAFSDTKDIYKLEKFLMRKIEMWPGDNLINKKPILIFLSGILTMNLFQIVFLCRNSFFESMFEYTHCLVEFLHILNFNICILIFFLKRNETKKLVKDFEECWKSCKFSLLKLTCSLHFFTYSVIQENVGN
jgi:hypothetical protein